MNFGRMGAGFAGMGTPRGGARSGFPRWIFATGLWADTGYWQDAREWAPAWLFMNNQFWWDTGAWDDTKVW